MHVQHDIEKLRVVCGPCLRNKKKINLPAIDVSEMPEHLQVFETQNCNNFIIPIEWKFLEEKERTFGKEKMYEMEEICQCQVCHNDMKVYGLRWISFNRMTGKPTHAHCEYNHEDGSCLADLVPDSPKISNL